VFLFRPPRVVPPPCPIGSSAPGARLQVDAKITDYREAPLKRETCVSVGFERFDLVSASVLLCLTTSFSPAREIPDVRVFIFLSQFSPAAFRPLCVLVKDPKGSHRTPACNFSTLSYLHSFLDFLLFCLLLSSVPLKRSGTNPFFSARLRTSRRNGRSGLASPLH